MESTRLREILEQEQWLEDVLRQDAFGKPVKKEKVDFQQVELWALSSIEHISLRPWTDLDIENGRNVVSVAKLDHRLRQPVYPVRLELYRIYYFLNGKEGNRGFREGFSISLSNGCNYPPNVESGPQWTQSSYPLRVEMVKLDEGTETASLFNDIQSRPEYFAVIKMTVDGLVELNNNSSVRSICDKRTYEIYKAPTSFRPRRDLQDTFYLLPEHSS